MIGHDIIVIGCSAGGLEPLMQLVQGLPRDLPAAVCIVMHTWPYSKSMLPHILTRLNTLPAVPVLDGDVIRPGCIYIAPPDYHLRVEEGILRLGHGPKVYHSRPAIDPLFRSAAEAYGRRVVGVVLSGAGLDSAAGLSEIKQCGGIAIVQDPDEALHPAMPSNALKAVDVDYVLPAAQIGPTLVELARDPLGKKGVTTMPDESQQAAGIRRDTAAQIRDQRLEMPSIYACPDCGGVMWQVNDARILQFRCRIGHLYAGEDLLDQHTEKVEDILWSAARMLTEKAILARQLAAHAQQQGEQADTIELLETQAQASEQQAPTITQLIETGQPVRKGERPCSL